MQAQVFFQDQEASRGGPGGRKGPWRLERAKDTMPRLARRVEFVGLMLLGLLPTYAINTHAVQKLDPAAAFAAAAPCARPPRPGRAVAGEPGPALCGARVPQWRSAGRPSGLVRLRCAAANGQHPNGPHAGHVAARNAAHGLQAREKILVTGGAGYIGSHICADLLQKDYDVVVLDNFVNSSPTALQRAMELGGRELTVYEGDTRDLAALRHVFESELTISSVIHLAGLKAVGESVAKPTMYYDFKYVPPLYLLPCSVPLPALGLSTRVEFAPSHTSHITTPSLLQRGRQHQPDAGDVRVQLQEDGLLLFRDSVRRDNREPDQRDGASGRDVALRALQADG